MRRLGSFERFAWAVGITLLAVYGVVRVPGAVMKHRELERFAEARRTAQQAELAGTVAGRAAALHPRLPVDLRRWSDVRIEAYEKTLVPSITLVTGFPLYYVGSAPQRCIVRGVRSASDATTGT